MERLNCVEVLFWCHPDYFIYFSRTGNKPNMAQVVLSLGERGKKGNNKRVLK